LEKTGQYRQEGQALAFIIFFKFLLVGMVVVIRLATIYKKNGLMKIKINKSDFERVVNALMIAEGSVKGTRSEELFRLTRKKLKRQAK
jgi:uncharacterized membrane protein